MKKLFILFIIVTGAVTEFTAQNIATPIDVKISETFKDSKKMTTLAFSVEDSKGGVIIGRNYNKGCYIEHYNEQLKLVEEYEMQMDNKRSRILDAFTKDSKLMLVEYLQNADAEELQYVIHKTDMDKFAFESSVLFSIPFSEYKKNILEDIWSKSIFGMGKEDQDASGEMSDSWIDFSPEDSRLLEALGNDESLYKIVRENYERVVAYVWPDGKTSYKYVDESGYPINHYYPDL